MTPTVQVGPILIGEESPRMAEVLALESEPYLRNWSVVNALDGFALDDKIHAAGWNFFFMAGEVKVMFFGAIGAAKVRDALKRILRKVKQQNFNCLEVTGIVAFPVNLAGRGLICSNATQRKPGASSSLRATRPVSSVLLT